MEWLIMIHFFVHGFIQDYNPIYFSLRSLTVFSNIAKEQEVTCINMFGNVLNFPQLSDHIFFKLELLVKLYIFIKKFRSIQNINFLQDFVSASENSKCTTEKLQLLEASGNALVSSIHFPHSCFLVLSEELPPTAMKLQTRYLI